MNKTARLHQFRRLRGEELEDRALLSVGALGGLDIRDLLLPSGMLSGPDAYGRIFAGPGPSPESLPRFSVDNANAADTANADQLRGGGSLGLNLSGAGYTVGIWDGGWARTTHQEFGGRVTVKDTTGATNYHATHVAGTIGGQGVMANARGMANQLNLWAYDWTSDTSEMAVAGASIIASNHSYGYVHGWEGYYATGPNGLKTYGRWYADRALYSEDPGFGKYNSASAALDTTLYNNPYLLSVWSAGNSRDDVLSSGYDQQYYYTYLSSGGANGAGYYWLSINDPTWPAPPGDGAQGGFDNLSEMQAAKNNLVVGAISDITADPFTASNVALLGFSSWGPADDGRIRPDVVANGESLYSAYDTSDTSYASMSGTSMSSPTTTGVAALLVEHYEDVFAARPRAATTRGLLIHTALDAGNVGPDYSYGWGVVDAAAAASFLTAAGAADDTRSVRELTYGGSEYTLEVASDGSEPLKATIVWTDPAGTAQAAGVDVATPVLVRDLDLWITGPGGTYLPWTLSRTSPANPALRTAANHLDNVEQVLIDAPAAGVYTLHVGRTGASFTQAYSLLISGAGLDPPLVADVVDVAPDPRTTAIDSITITFSDVVSNVDIGDLVLWRDGATVAFGGGQWLTMLDSTTFLLLGLRDLTAAAGNYRLTVVAAASGIVDPMGKPLAADAVDQWENRAVAADIIDVADPRVAALDTVMIVFTEVVAGLDLGDFRLQRNGVDQSLAGATLVQQTDTTWFLKDLAGSTGRGGDYTLRLVAAGSDVVDADGNPLAGDAIEQWQMVNPGPAADVVNVFPNPRRSRVETIAIDWTEAVAGLDIGDFRLDRDGVFLPLGGVASLVQSDANTWVLGGLGSLTGLGGVYTLRVVAADSGIVDDTGEPMTADATESWQRLELAADVVDVAPDPRSAAVAEIVIRFDEEAAGFDLADLTLRRNGGANLLGAGETLVQQDATTWILGGLGELTTPLGSYELRLVAAGSGIATMEGGPLATDAADTWLTASTGSVRGSVWNDADGDGVWDSGEAALAGWTIYDDANGNGVFDAGEASTTTAANGSYQLSDLLPGSYAVAVVDQAGWRPTSPRPSGSLGFLGFQKDGTAAVDGLAGAQGVAISPDGLHVYVAAGTDSAVAVFRRLAGGTLEFVETKKDGAGGVDGLAGAAAVCLSPDGAHVYVVSATDDAVAAFARNAATGALTFVGYLKDGIGGVDGLDGAADVAVSPDGLSVYVAAANDSAVAVFRRNFVTGALTFVEAKKDGVGGLDGLGQAQGLACSADGAHLYVAAASDNAVTAFTRNAATGALTFLELKKDGAGGVDGLAGVRKVVVSLDGTNVYAASETDQAVACFWRSTTTGALAYLECKKDGAGGVDGLGGAANLVISPDGRQVYASGKTDDAVAIFRRGIGNGSLTYLHLVKDGVNGVDGLDDARGLAVTPDGKQLLAAGWADNALAVLPRDDSVRQQVTVAAGLAVEGVVFGRRYYPSGLRGSVWSDADADGVWDAGERALPGGTVYLDGNGNAQFDAGEALAVVDAAGGYQFANLVEGSYAIAIAARSGWQSAYPLSTGRWSVAVAAGRVAAYAHFGSRDVAAPTDIALSGTAIVENAAIGTVVGVLTTTDNAPSGSTFVYSLVAGSGGTDNAAFTVVGDQLRTAAAVNFETKSSYSVRLRTADPNGLTFEEVFLLSVTNVNEAPTAYPSSYTTLEDAAVAVTLAGSDPEYAPLGYIIVAAPLHGTLSGTGAARIYTPHSHYSGADSFTYKVNDGVNDSPAATVSLTVTGVAPKVTGIYARGSGWSAGYLGLLQAAGLGTAAAGFRLLDGAGQLSNAAALSWQNVNRLSVSFNEAVTLGAGSLRLVDSNNANVGLAAGGFSYDAATKTASWTLAGNLGRGKYVLALDANTIRDAGNLALDGEWTTGATTYATSGNNVAGGNLYFRFNCLPGDVTLNGQTNTGDVGMIRVLGTAVPTAQNYRCDVTGNNQINTGDLGFVRTLGTLTLAGLAEPTVPPVGMSGDGDEFVADALSLGVDALAHALAERPTFAPAAVDALLGEESVRPGLPQILAPAKRAAGKAGS